MYLFASKVGLWTFFRETSYRTRLENVKPLHQTIKHLELSDQLRSKIAPTRHDPTHGSIRDRFP